LNQRFYSLDVFRGATVALMILVNNPGSWEHIYTPLEHAPWHGCTPTDLVFPFFLFAVGNAMAFVMPRLEAAGNAVFLKKVFKRTLLIFAIGLFLNWFPFVRWNDNDQLVFRCWINPLRPENGVRILGVLQRIALCYFFASLIIYYFKIRGAFVAACALLLGYWILCLLLGMPGDPYSLQGFFGLNIDKAILGIPHMFKGEGVPFDPEGLVSTIPAIVQVIFGYFTGNYILQKGKTHEMLSNLFVAGCLLVFTGLCWSGVFPLNKKIWTSSFVVYTSGLAILVLCVMLHLIEFRNQRGMWTRFFDVFGKNPLFIFVLSGMLPRTLGLIRWANGTGADGKTAYTSPLPWFYEHICKPVSENLNNGSLLYALITVGFFWFCAYLMDRGKVYIRV
jgi:predicted acyltransferase